MTASSARRPARPTASSSASWRNDCFSSHRLLLRSQTMDITRRAVLMTSAAIAANVLRPELAFAQPTPRKGGVFTVHYGAEQRQLNPSLQASTGVYIIGGKIQEALVDLDAA